MRALPLPRRSRRRKLRKLLHKLYKLATLQFLFRSRGQIIIKRRRIVLPFSTRKYKVKVPRRDRPAGKCHRALHPFRRRVATTQVMMNNNTTCSNRITGARIKFERQRRLSRLPFKCTTAVLSQIM